MYLNLCILFYSEEESTSADEEESSESESGSDESDFASGESEDESAAEEAETAMSHDEDSQITVKRKTVSFATESKHMTDSESESEKSSIKLKSPEKR